MRHSIDYILPYCLIEENRLLSHIANLAPQLCEVIVLHINSIYQNLAWFTIIKSFDKLHDRAFSGARGTNNGRGFTILNIQIRRSKDFLFGIIAERNILEDDISFQKVIRWEDLGLVISRNFRFSFDDLISIVPRGLAINYLLKIWESKCQREYSKEHS